MPRGEGNPQLEDGFARIATEILEALTRTPLSDYESRCIHHLWRQTYGWKDQSGQTKKADRISYGQWAEATGMSRRNAIRTLNMLVERQIIHKRDLPNFRQAEWAFNKHWKEWDIDLEAIFNLRKRLRGESKRVVSPGTPSRLEKAAEVVSPGTLSKAKSDRVVSPGTPSLVSPGTPSVVSPGTPTIDRLTIDRLTKPPCLPARARGDEILEFLQGLTRWKRDDEADRQWLAEFITDYPEFNIKLARASRDYHSEKKSHDKAMWKNRMRSWCDHERKFEAERGKDIGRAGRTRSTHPGRVPTGEEIKEQMRRYGIGQQDDDTGDL